MPQQSPLDMIIISIFIRESEYEINITLLEQLKNGVGALVYSNGECNQICVSRKSSVVEKRKQNGKEQKKKKPRNSVHSPDDESFPQGF